MATIKELAEQAGLSIDKYGLAWDKDNPREDGVDLERFAELVRQDEREQISHTYLKLTLEAVLREREACAKLCEEEAPTLDGQLCAEAIREKK